MVNATVEVERPRPGVGLITINRPDKFNAIDPATDQAMSQAIQALDQNPSVRCIVITGAGSRAFSAGADIGTLLPHLKRQFAEGRDDPQFCGVTHRHETAKPLLAAINGVAYGGGLELALACDLRIASSAAMFGLPEIRVGVLAGAGGCTRLPRSMSPALAAEMILTGEPIDAQRALAQGLVSRVVEPDQLMRVCLDLAASIAQRAPQALRACTELIRRPRMQELADALRQERQALGALLATRDADEGISAFMARREPIFVDR